MSFLRLVSLSAWLLAVAAVGAVLLGSPHWYRLAALEFYPQFLPDGASPGWDLGREELAAASADARHLRVARDDQGWGIANLSPRKAVLLARAGESAHPLRSWALQAGDRVVLGDTTFVVLIGGDILELSSTRTGADGEEETHRWRWDGRSLQRDGVALPGCDDTGLAWARNPFTHLPWRDGPLWLGGHVHCEDRVGIPAVPPLTVQVVRDATAQGAWRLGYARGGDAALPALTVLPAGQADAGVDLRALGAYLRDGDQLTLGYTRYRVGVRPATSHAPSSDAPFVLAPLSRSWRVVQPPASAGAASSEGHAVERDSGVRWQPLHPRWQDDGVLSTGLIEAVTLMAIGAGGGVVSGLLMLRGAFQRRALGVVLRVIAAGGIAGGALALLGLGGRESPPVLGVALMLALAALGLWAWPANRTSGALAIGLRAVTVALTGFGLASLALLGLGAAESHWMAHAGRFAALVAVLFAAGSVLAMWIHDRPQRLRIPEPWLRRALWGLGLTALAGLFLQFGFGGEGGVWGTQPFELAKFSFVALTALAMAERMELVGMHRGIRSWRLWVSIGLPVVVLAAMMVLALALLRDFSPFVLLAGAGFALLWSYLAARLERRRHWVHIAALTLLVVTFGGLQWIKGHPQVAAAIPQGERLLVWAQPERYPHTGYQVRMAERLIRDGGRRGAWTPGATIEFASPWHELRQGTHENTARPGNGRVMALPAVQDDFALAFALNRFGAAWGVMLAGLQGLLIGLLLWIATRVRRGYLARRDFALRPLAWTGGFAIAGGAGLLATHFLVSWGTNLQFLPVMGQPMPLLSAGGSHLSVFVVPLLLLATILEEGHGHD